MRGSRFTPAQTNSISRIGGLVLINAMIFQEILASLDQRVVSLNEVVSDPYPQEKLLDHWKFIVEEINYHPIFHVAREVLMDCTADKEIMDCLRELGRGALRIVAKRAALRHDLMGRVYHRLLADAKYLGTYYTSIPAADLLLKLALRSDKWPADWSDLDQLKEFQVADLACGTGTLLMAAADGLMDNYIASSASSGQEIHLADLHRTLAEDVLYGYDVLPSALHLTASTLALKAPDVVFNSMNLFSLALGGPHHRLGSIEFLRSTGSAMMLDLFGGPSAVRRVGTRGPDQQAVAKPPQTDLCVMNPPFTRSVGGNLLFGSAPPEERAEMQKEMKKLVKESGAFASITAGLGSVFVAIADRYIKPGGRIALVLPKALLSGVAWDKTRQLLRGKYEVEYIVASHDPVRWNFSESTDLSEVLLVARKLENGEAVTPSGQVTAVNLWRNPTTSFDALAVAGTLARGRPPDIETGQGALYIEIGKQRVGEAVAMPWDVLKGQYSWMLPCAFAQSDLIRAARYLTQCRLWIPGRKELTPVPLSPLSGVADLGPDVRDMHDGFTKATVQTAYPAFWDHDASSVLTMRQQPNLYLSPLGSAKPNRPLRKAVDLWALAGKVVIAERLWLKTQRIAAASFANPVLSNVWWTVRLKAERGADQKGKVLTLWLNSTPGLLLMLAHREETRGAWVKFKKPILARLPVLDVGILSGQHGRKLAAAYDEMAGEGLQPLPAMASDPIRARIDEAISKVLGLPDLSLLRTLLAQEPIIRLERL